MSGEPGNPNKHGVYLGEDYVPLPPHTHSPSCSHATTAEPWCNHDPAAVRDGVCECGATVLYVAAYGEAYSHDDPFYTIGAYSTADKAKDACEADAAHNLGFDNDEAPPAIKWQGDETGTAYWTGAQPYGYRITRMAVDDAGSKPEPDDVACGQADEN